MTVSWQIWISGQESHDNITLGKYRSFPSKILEGDIKYFVDLPVGYEKTDKSYPVLYFLNAQMLSTVANTVATVDRLSFELIPEMVVIGICNTGAATSYFPQRPDGSPGGADQFLAFLTQEFIPYVKMTYRTVDFSVLMGQSNTGLFAVYAYLTAPEAFKACIAASPSLGWCLDFMVGKAELAIKTKRSPASLLYMNYGEKDYKDLVILPIGIFSRMLKDKSSEDFNWTAEFLKNDGHVPITSLNNGLLAIFPDYFIEDEVKDQGLQMVDSHYEKLSQRYGFTIQAPEEALFYICYQHKRKKEYEQAIRNFEILCRRYPQSVRGYYYQGETYREMGDLENACRCYLKSLEIDPDFEAAKKQLLQIRENDNSKYFFQSLPSIKPEPFGRGILNSATYWPHSAPIFIDDCKEVYFSVFYPENLSKPKDILFCRLEDGVWSSPQAAPFSSDHGDDCPMISPDGKYLYFASDRPLSTTSRNRKYNIWFVERNNGAWTEPRNLGTNIETEARNLYSPVATNSGNLYFSGNDKAFNQNHDIYCAQYMDGAYAPAEKLGNTINSNLHESWFYVAPDESFLIFFSGAQGEGSDLCISFRDKDGKWKKRKSMGDIVNSVGVRMPALSPDKKFLFFQGGEGCWWMDAKIIDYLKINDLDFTDQLAAAVEEKGIDIAVYLFWELKGFHGEYFMLDEKRLNQKGYIFLRYNKFKEAISLFRLNAALFPESFNVYDSLGEAYMKTYQNEQAIKYYQKSLELNPENENARKMLKKIK